MGTAWALFSLVLSGVLSARAFCPDHCDCQHAQHLLCTNRGLHAVPKVSTRGSGDILVLSLGGNFISNISALDLSRFGRMTRLDLHYNQIQTVHPKAFEKLSRLEELYLGNNLLSAISDGILQPLKKLRILDANSNKIRKIAPNTFVNLDNLIKLRLDKNSIKTLQDSVFKGLGSLQYLHLESNGLAHIHQNAFTNLENLRFLNLSDNGQIALLNERTFAPLASLTTLLLSGNDIQRVGQRVFHNLKSLITLSLSNSNISRMEPGALRGLASVRQLLIDGNQLAEIPPRLLDPLRKLEELDLSRNRISRLHSAAFNRLKQLKILKLNENLLRSLAGDTFSWNSGLHRLELGDNVWTCDCGLAAFQLWIRQAHAHGRLLSVLMRCHRPAHLMGKYLDYLSSEELQSAGNLTCASAPSDRGGALEGGEVQADQGRPSQSQQTKRRKGVASRPGPAPRASASLKRVQVELRAVTGTPLTEATPPVEATPPPPAAVPERLQQWKEPPLEAAACRFNRHSLCNITAELLSPDSAHVQWELRPMAEALPPLVQLQFRVRYDRFAASPQFPRFVYLGGGARGVTLRELAPDWPYQVCVESVVGGVTCRVASRDHCAGVITQHAMQVAGGGSSLQLVTVAMLAANALLLLAVGGVWMGRRLRRRLRNRKTAVNIRHMYSTRRPLRTMATEAVSGEFSAYQSGRPLRLGSAEDADLIQFPCDRFHDNGSIAHRDDAIRRFQD